MDPSDCRRGAVEENAVMKVQVLEMYTTIILKSKILSTKLRAKEYQGFVFCYSKMSCLFPHAEIV